MPLLKSIGLLTQALSEQNSGLWQLRDAVLVWRDGLITWVGSESQLPSEFVSESSFDAGGWCRPSPGFSLLTAETACLPAFDRQRIGGSSVNGF